MKNVEIKSNNIGSSIVAEKATIKNITGSINQQGVQEDALIELILDQSKVLENTKQIVLTEEQIKNLALQLSEAMNKLKNENDNDKKKNIISEMVKNIKSTIGVTSDALQAVLKLATLFGV